MSGPGQQAPLRREQQAYVAEAAGLVESRVAWHVRRTGASWLAPEMKSAGDQAVVECAGRFSAKWRATFRTFARYRVEGAILDVLRAEARQGKLRNAARAAARWGVHVAEISGEDALDPVRDDEAAADRKLRRALQGKALSAMLAFAGEVEALAASEPDPEEIAALRPVVEELRSVRDGLTEREQRLLSCVYDRGLDLHDAAVELGLAYPTVKVLHAKLLHRLREKMAERGVASPFSGG